MRKQMAPIRELSSDELISKEKELRSHIVKLRLQKVMGKLENTSLIKASRHELARIKTVLTQKL